MRDCNCIRIEGWQLAVIILVCYYDPGELETLQNISAGMAVSHISVDWVNSELYYVDSSSSNGRVCAEIS